MRWRRRLTRREALRRHYESILMVQLHSLSPTVISTLRTDLPGVDLVQALRTVSTELTARTQTTKDDRMDRLTAGWYLNQIPPPEPPDIVRDATEYLENYHHDSRAAALIDGLVEEVINLRMQLRKDTGADSTPEPPQE